METAGHNSIGTVKRLLNPVAMMNIDIDIQHSRMYASDVRLHPEAGKRHTVAVQEYQEHCGTGQQGLLINRNPNGNSHIVDVTEPTCLCLLGMVQTPGPIDSNIGLTSIQPFGAT